MHVSKQYNLVLAKERPAHTLCIAGEVWRIAPVKRRGLSTYQCYFSYEIHLSYSYS